MKSSHEWLPRLFAFVASLFLSACGFLGGMSQHLKEHGVSAEATIVDVWDTGITVNDDPVVGLRVEVRPENRPSFHATIERLLVSRVEIPQVQPGQVLLVRFDPDNPSDIAVDSGNGNPYHDNFITDSVSGSRVVASSQPASLYRGTNIDDDYVAMLENGFTPLGVAIVDQHGEDVSLAARQGKEIGAANVVVYAPASSPAPSLADLPFRRKSAPSAHSPASLSKRLPSIARTSWLAVFWGKNEPWTFGLYGRDLNAAEQQALKTNAGIVTELVPAGSPAEAAGLLPGDVIVAIDGRTMRDVHDLSDSYIDSIAGKRVTVEILRDGKPLTIPVQLSPRAAR